MSDTHTNEYRRIGIIDPHPVTRHGVGNLLTKSRVSLTWEVECSNKARTNLRPGSTDVVIYEPAFELTRAFSFVKELREEHPQIIVIIHTMVTANSWLLDSMQMGVRALVSKRSCLADLITAMETVIAGRAYISADILDGIFGSAGKSPINVSRLSAREKEVFRMIGLGQKTSDIAKTLGISPRTVDAHKQHIKDKLRIDASNGLTLAAGSWLQSEWSGPVI